MLPVFNGADYLPMQLDSLLAQTLSDWHLLISDDGSRDGSRDILEQFQKEHPSQATVFNGPQNGISANYFSLLARVHPDTPFVAYCDQDDVWNADKIDRAIQMLSQTDAPAMYCSRTTLIDAQGVALRRSPPCPRPPSFQNALCQNIASGNTMVLNKAGWHLLNDHADAARTVAFHDWWTYQIITGAGGVVFHDDRPSLSYRQHSTNALGAATGASGANRRLKRVARQNLSRDISSQIDALQNSVAALTPAHAEILNNLAQTRAANPLSRLRGVVKSGLYRQSRMGTVGLWLAALMGRF